MIMEELSDEEQRLVLAFRRMKARMKPERENPESATDDPSQVKIRVTETLGMGERIG